MSPIDAASSSQAWLDAIAEAAGAAGIGTERFLDELAVAFSRGNVGELLPPDAATAAGALGSELTRIAKTRGEPACPPSMFNGVSGAIVLAWLESRAADQDVVVAGMLELVLRAHQAPSRLIRAARARVIHGPLVDALRCLPLAGDAEWLFDDPVARARLELLVWEAGGAALSFPQVGGWLFASDAFRRLVVDGSRGALRHRVLAARLLNIAADGFPADEVDAARGIHTARITRDLAHHPEPLVWISAARAMGRLAAKSRDVRSLLCRWLDSDNVGERRRAITALAAMPGAESWWLESRLEDLFRGDGDPWALAALGPAVPYLAVERRELWLDLVVRIESKTTSPEMLWSMTQGLLCLEKRGHADRTTRTLLEKARKRAMQSQARSTTEAQLFDDIRRHTDFLYGIDPDPNDLDLLFQRSVTVAVRVGAERVVPQVRGLIRSLAPTLEYALERMESPGSMGASASALSSAESCARSAALALWEPLLEASGAAPLHQPELSMQLENIRKQTAQLLLGDKADYARHRCALRMLGSFADAACDAGERAEASAFLSNALAEPTWITALDRRDASRFQKTMGDVLWRVVDGSKDPSRPSSSAALYTRFAAWWAVAAPRADLLDFLARSEPSARTRVGADVEGYVRVIRDRLKSADAAKGGWTAVIHEAFDALNAGETALDNAMTSLGVALDQADKARHVRGPTASTVALIALGDACAELAPLLASPRQALLGPGECGPDESVRALMHVSIKALEGGEDTPEERAASWRKELGPIVGPLVDRCISRVLSKRRRRPLSAVQRRQIGAYKLDRRLGGGTQGDVWLVENDKTGRRFVMKLLAADGLSKRTAEDRDALKIALQMEADILKQIYHPNVANFVDNGWADDQPYLVLEYLVGCDLETYGFAGLLSLEEMKPVVHDVAAGLSALSNFGLVHCDLKPGNIFLRLGLPAGEGFDRAHRDPGVAPVLGAVVIDFGVSRTMAVLEDEPADTVSGTLGYIAPEQADGVVHPRTDVYALAATVFRALTGRSFFDHFDGIGRRLLAHNEVAPMKDPEHRQHLNAPELIRLLEEATALDPESRPSIQAFAERFADL